MTNDFFHRKNLAGLLFAVLFTPVMLMLAPYIALTVYPDAYLSTRAIESAITELGSGTVVTTIVSLITFSLLGLFFAGAWGAVLTIVQHGFSLFYGALRVPPGAYRRRYMKRTFYLNATYAVLLGCSAYFYVDEYMTQSYDPVRTFLTFGIPILGFAYLLWRQHRLNVELHYE